MWWEGQDFGIGSRIRKVARDCLPSSSAGQLAIRNQQSLERKIKVWTNCSNVQMRGALKKEEILNKGGVGWVRTPNHPKCVIKNLFVFFTFFGEKWHFIVVTNLGHFPKKAIFSASWNVFVVGQLMPDKSSECSELECLQKMWSDYRLIKRSACLLAIWSVSRGWEHSGGGSICHYPRIIQGEKEHTGWASAIIQKLSSHISNYPERGKGEEV